jgi:2-polyprenyl-6-hydroxyphenyl methylase / 3-demethylubiquinone-9 3-methyltransferase
MRGFPGDMALRPSPSENDVFERLGGAWWDDDEAGSLSSLRYGVNRPRFRYYRGIIGRYGGRPQAFRKILDIGCGGGYLAEEFAKAGFSVTGLDPVHKSLETALAHARQSSLAIRYLQGVGEAPPFAAASFDAVLCCDVLEHVSDYCRVTAEIARVLRPGGLFFFETINRNFLSWLFMIKLLQDWKYTAFMERDLHLWKKFIKPGEMKQTLAENGLDVAEMRGWFPGGNPVTLFRFLRKRLRGEISHRDLAEKLDMRVGSQKIIAYLGYAVKL